MFRLRPTESMTPGAFKSRSVSPALAAPISRILLNGVPMKSVISAGLILLVFSSAPLAQDLSEFGEKVEAVTVNPAKRTSKGNWTRAACTDVQRMEKMITEGARPTDRPFLRMGLLFLQQEHCGIDVSAKLAADQKILDDEKRQADRDFKQNMEAASRAASSPPPAPSMHCLTRRLPNGAVSTDCE